MTYAVLLLTIAVIILDAVLLSIFRGADKARETDRMIQDRYHKVFLEQWKVSNIARAEMNEVLDKIAQAITKKEAE